MELKNTLIYYDHYHLKLNLKKQLRLKWRLLKLFIGLMFRGSSEEIYLQF